MKLRFSPIILRATLILGLVISTSATFLPAPGASAATGFLPGRIIDDPVFTDKNSMSVSDIQAFLNGKVPTCDTNHAANQFSQNAVPPWRCLKDYVENPTTGANNLNNLRRPAFTTNGDLNTADYTFIEGGARWIKIDLGAATTVGRIKLWHYFGDTRTYRDVIVQLSTTADFSSGVTTVFNNDVNNTAGQGAGAQAEYTETSAGKEITFSPLSARYIRLWSNGSTANGGNHYVEVQAFAGSGATTNLALNKTVTSNSMYTLQPAGGISAAQIIWNAAQQFGISPKVLLVTLQKENGLVTDSWPYPWQFRTAMGFGCPDTAACDPNFFGFSKQMHQAARHFRNFYDENPNWTVPYKVGSRFIQYSPNKSCGGSDVNITTHGTAALYNYTPYQPNSAALAAGFGSGDSCSAYGNRNFFNYYNAWFGSTLMPTHGSRYLSQSYTSSLMQGKSMTATITYKNTGTATWRDNTTATDGKPVRLATSHGINRRSSFGSAWGGDQNRASGVFSQVLQADGTPYATNPHVVQPGESGTFTFTLTAPATLAPGTYREFFQPIVEGGSTMNDPWTFLDIKVLPITYSSAYAGQSAYPKLQQNQRSDMWLRYKNTGNVNWYDDASSAAAGAKPVHLATSHSVNRRSRFGSLWGGDQNRTSGLFGAVYESDGTTLAADQHVAAPGQIVQFDIPVASGFAPPGTYREFFQPIVEGGSSMNDPWTFMDIVVTPTTFASQYAGQGPYASITRDSSTASYLMYKNVGNAPWYDARAVPPGSRPTVLSTSHRVNRPSAVADLSNGGWCGNTDRNRPACTFDAVYEADGTTLASNQRVAQPGQIVKFTFNFRAETFTLSGTYREFFQPILEGGSLMNDPWTFLDVTVK